jgi:hypothetical protein
MRQFMTQNKTENITHPILPTSQQMYELRKIYGVEGARQILSDYYGIDLCRYKYGINAWEAQVILKDNPNKNTRDNMICELHDRGVDIALIATMSGFSRQSIHSIINYQKKQREL